MARYAGKGTVLQRGDGADPEVFAAVGQLLEIGEVGSTRDLIDASAFGDDEKQYVTGMRDGSELTLTVAFDPANTTHTGLKSDYDDGDVTRNFRLVHPNETRYLAFSAVYTSYNETPDRDGLYQATVGVKITGAVTTGTIP